MKTMDAYKEIMKIRDLRPTDICDQLGIKSNVLSERFKQKNVSVTKLNEMLAIAGYKIVLVPQDTEIPEGAFEVE